VRTPVVWALVVLLLMGVASMGFNAWLTIYEVGSSQRQWCAVLTAITQVPPPPLGAHPTAQQLRSQHIYGELLKLRHNYGCG
jgi:hypothetical protein